MNRLPAISAARHGRGWLPGLLLLIFGTPAMALEVLPILAEVKPGVSVASFELRNPRTTEFRLQVDTRDWSQDGELEHNTEGGDLIVVPRIVNLAPGATQRVRVALRGSADRSTERAYRVIFRELPPPPEPGFTGLRTQLQIGVPLFFRAASTTPAAPEFRAYLHADGGLAIAASNAGGRYASFSSLRLTHTDGAVLGESQGPHYVLAGSGRHWRLRTHATPSSGTALQLIVTANGQDETIPLTLD